jgi:hypothetical protein
MDLNKLKSQLIEWESISLQSLKVKEGVLSGV